jgi:hypothetical protein
MRKIFQSITFVFACLIISAVNSFAQNKNSKDVPTKLSGTKNNSQNIVVDTLKTPSPSAKHQLTGTKNTPASSSVDVEPLTIPTGVNKVNGKKQ